MGYGREGMKKGGNDMEGMDEVYDMKWRKWKGQPRSRTYERRMEVYRSMDGKWMSEHDKGNGMEDMESMSRSNIWKDYGRM